MQKSLSFRLRTFLFFGILINQAWAQPIAEYTRLREKYPKADVVCTAYDNTMELKLKEGKLMVNYETREEFFYLTDNNSGYSKRSFHVSSMYKLNSYSATLFSPAGNKYRKSEVTEFTSNDFTNDHIFYDDSKELAFMFPQIIKGAKTQIYNGYQITDAHFLPKMALSPFLDYDQFTYTVKVQDGIDISVDTFFTSVLNLKQTQVKKGGFTIYTWSGPSPKTHEYENDGPNRNYFAPQIIVRIKQYHNGTENIKVLSDLNDLYQWNCDFVKQSKEEAASFKSLSDSIVGKEQDPAKKASLLFGWVQSNIRYIALEFGYDGFIPAKASVVCKERYGDCKGISNLLYNLLRSQGLDAHLVWIGTRDIPYKYSQLTSSSISNHMITALRLNNSWIFLDGTANNLPFGLPSPFIQGKEAMISFENCEKYELANVEIVPEQVNNMHDSCYTRLDGRTLRGEGIASLYGYKKMAFADKLTERNYRVILNQCRAYLLKGSNRFVLDTVWLENLDERNKPLVIHYKFNIPDYAILVDNEYYINPNLDRLGISEKIDMKRNVPVEYRFLAREENINVLEIPAGKKLSLMPANTTWREGAFTFENQFELKNNQLVRKQLMVRTCMSIPLSEFKTFNTLVDTMLKSYSEQITLHP